MESADGAEIVESVAGWLLYWAMEPANDSKGWYHAAPPILCGEGYVLGVDPRNGRAKGMLGSNGPIRMFWENRAQVRAPPSSPRSFGESTDISRYLEPVKKNSIPSTCARHVGRSSE